METNKAVALGWVDTLLQVNEIDKKDCTILKRKAFDYKEEECIEDSDYSFVTLYDINRNVLCKITYSYLYSYINLDEINI